MMYLPRRTLCLASSYKSSNIRGSLGRKRWENAREKAKKEKQHFMLISHHISPSSLNGIFLFTWKGLLCIICIFIISFAMLPAERNFYMYNKQSRDDKRMKIKAAGEISTICCFMLQSHETEVNRERRRYEFRVKEVMN